MPLNEEQIRNLRVGDILVSPSEIHGATRFKLIELDLGDHTVLPCGVQCWNGSEFVTEDDGYRGANWLYASQVEAMDVEVQPIQLSDLEVGMEFQFPIDSDIEGTERLEDVVGTRNMRGLKCKVICLDTSSLPIGFHVWHNGGYVDNRLGGNRCFWLEKENLAHVTLIEPTPPSISDRFGKLDYHPSFGGPEIVECSGDRGNFYIKLNGGNYIHKDGFIYNQTCNAEEEYNGYYQTANDCNMATQLFELNSRFQGNPRISNDNGGGRCYISFEGEGAFYLHKDGVGRHGAMGDGTTAWYDSREEALIVAMEYIVKKEQFNTTVSNGVTLTYDMLREMSDQLDDQMAMPSIRSGFEYIRPIAEPVREEKEYYVTFTPDMLKDYNLTDDEAMGLMLNIDTYSEEDVIDELAEFFGDDKRNHFAIYEGSDTRRLLINEMGYQAYSRLLLSMLKKPDTPDNYNKTMFIEHDLANALMNIDSDFNKLFCRGTRVGGYYQVASTNAFNSSYIKKIKQEGHKVTSNKQELRLGRVIKAFAGHLFTDLDIEGIVSKFKVEYELDTSIVKTSKNVSEIYGMDECGGSCMAEKPSSWFDIYEDMNSEIAYIEIDGDLKARALIHTVVDCENPDDEYVVLDRIFFDDEKSKLTMQQWRKEQPNMTRMSYHDDIHFRGKYAVNNTYDNVPYVDNLCYAQEIDGDMYLCNSQEHGYDYDYLQETEGNSDRDNISQGSDIDEVYCEDTGEYVPRDDAYYCDGNGYYYADDDNLVYISHRGYLHESDDDIAYDEDTSEYRLKEDLKYIESGDFYTSSDSYHVCDNDNEYHHEDDLVWTEDGYTVTSDNATYIEDKDYHVYHTDSYFEHDDDGKWYSYEEELEEDEEVA